MQEITDDKLEFKYNWVDKQLSVIIDEETLVSNACTALAGNAWVTVALSIISDNDGSIVQFYCDHTLISTKTTSKKLDFALENFQIGDGYSGYMKEFKLFHFPMG